MRTRSPARVEAESDAFDRLPVYLAQVELDFEYVDSLPIRGCFVGDASDDGAEILGRFWDRKL